MTKLKVSPCPWCLGRGTRLWDEPVFPIKVGEMLKMKSAECEQCEGSGVIAFKALTILTEPNEGSEDVGT